MTLAPLCCKVASAFRTSGSFFLEGLLVPLQLKAFGIKSSRLDLSPTVWLRHVLHMALSF